MTSTTSCPYRLTSRKLFFTDKPCVLPKGHKGNHISTIGDRGN
jgi:hypothetical protein